MRIVLASGAILLAAAYSPAPAPMAPPEIAILTILVGRWGVTMEACAPANASNVGVIEITASTVAMGVDNCTIGKTQPNGAGALMLLQCKSGEGGEDDERDAKFVSSTPETMTWVNEGGGAEPYVRCS